MGTLFIVNIFSKSRWFCNKMGWYKSPKVMGFDGASMGGECPRCQKKVLQDSQGNWF